MEILRRIDRLRKRYLSGIGIPLLIMIVIGITVVYFQGSTLFSSNDMFGELRKKISPIPEQSAPSPFNEAFSEKKNSAFAPISTTSNNSYSHIPVSSPVENKGPNPSPNPQTKPQEQKKEENFHVPLAEKKTSAVAPISTTTNNSYSQIPISSPVENKGPSPSPNPQTNPQEQKKEENFHVPLAEEKNSAVSPISTTSNNSHSQIPISSPSSKREEMKVEKRICSKERDSWKRRRTPQPVRSIQDMEKILLRNQRYSCSMVPRWSSPVDQDILLARREILNAPIVNDDPDLYPPVYRNFSAFRRSYDLMEKMLKVYVYKEGEKPIVHGAILWGIYAAEGWFMKQMEEKNRFLVDDPSKAHLFYLPFSSTNLRFRLFDPKIPRKRNLVEYLQAYVTKISTKYPFWNRTGGSDHFSVSCHDWASYLTAKAMGTSIRALCNGDLNRAFELGKDVSVTLTSVRDVSNPARNAGGRPGDKRDLLAFFAGQMHGYVRPLLLQQWGNDEDIKVYGPMRKGRKWDKTTYINSMRRTKYCLCPRGYEANSPRLAEAFFFECVPVIISDDFVPPFFEVLDWEAFSVVVPVKDIPRLKEILLGIPREKYLALQYGVQKVQRHFLWHPKPERYDLFHMTLHSVWYNRVFQLRMS